MNARAAERYLVFVVSELKATSLRFQSCLTSRVSPVSLACTLYSTGMYMQKGHWDRDVSVFPFRGRANLGIRYPGCLVFGAVWLRSRSM